MQLTKFWFKFKSSDNPSLFNLGCGVTAYHQQDAISLLQEKVFPAGKIPPVEECVEDVNVNALDSAHILPNIGDVTRRGVWFPKGYDI